MPNVLDYGPASIVEADERVRPFLPADEPSTTPVVGQLVNDGWAVQTGARFELTATGASRYADLLSEVSHYRHSPECSSSLIRVYRTVYRDTKRGVTSGV